MFTSLFALIGLPFMFGSTTIQSYVCQPPTNSVIVSPANGSSVVSGTTVAISGNATASSTVTLTEDGQPLATLTADQTNSFLMQTSFTVGSHKLDIAVANQCGNTTGASITITATQPVVVVTPPNITTGSGTSSSGGTVTSTNSSIRESRAVGSSAVTPQITPAPVTNANLTVSLNNSPDGTTTSMPSTYISGTTSLNSTIQISVNGMVVAHTDRASMSFGLSIPLSVGLNHITITATTVDGVQTVQNETINRSVPVPKSKQQIHKPWYKTTPGILAVTGGSLLLIILIIGLVILL